MERAERILMLQLIMMEIYHKYGRKCVGFRLAKKAKRLAKDIGLQPQVDLLDIYLTGKYAGRLLKWNAIEGGYLGLEVLHNITFRKSELELRSSEFQEMYWDNIKRLPKYTDDLII